MIEVHQLCRRYAGLVAVDDVSFSVTRGEIVGLLGHNGAGKTTIMKMITGYLEPTSGRMLIDGEEMLPESVTVRRRIGYLPENCPVWPEMTVLEYLDYQATLHGVPALERDAAIVQAIRRTDLIAKATSSIATLSRGYRQRVGVAQALLHNPDILILDEPTNGLDPTQIQHMRELILELAKTATVIISTHILQEVQAVCQRALIMRAGRLVIDARIDDLSRVEGLRVTVEGDAIQVLSGIEGVRSVRQEGIEGAFRHYLIDGDTALAPVVTKALIQANLALYALEPNRQDLETVFARVNSCTETEGAHV